MTDSPQEIIAREMAIAECGFDDAAAMEEPLIWARRYEEAAKQAGYAIVPIVPTDEMLDLAAMYHQNTGQGGAMGQTIENMYAPQRANCKVIWNHMIGLVP